MIADGLRSLHDSIVNVREGYQTTKRSMQQGVDDLGYAIWSTGKHPYSHSLLLVNIILKIALKCYVIKNTFLEFMESGRKPGNNFKLQNQFCLLQIV